MNEAMILMVDNNQDEVQTPCIGVCSMDNTTGYCLGCYRTLDEIKSWWEMPPADQKKLLLTLEKRQNHAISFD